jgi:hypothetical protein
MHFLRGQYKSELGHSYLFVDEVRRQMAIDLDIYKKKIWIVPRALVGTFDF